MHECPSPKPYKVSTITAIGSISTSVNLELFFRFLPVLQAQDEGFVYAEYGKKEDGLLRRGSKPVPLSSLSKASTRVRRSSGSSQADGLQNLQNLENQQNQQHEQTQPRDRRRASRHFDNQVTVIYRYFSRKLGRSETMNMKVFKNGKVQITGLKDPGDGEDAIVYLASVLRDMEMIVSGVLGDVDELAVTGFQVCLINSDFHLGFEIKRERLFALLRSAYGVICSYEPCIYPGVKVDYMWNEDARVCSDGLCLCVTKGAKTCCSGKGDGRGTGCCRKVTIAVFQSGSVIITGAHSLAQVTDAYDFIVGVARSCFDAIKKPMVIPPTQALAAVSDKERRTSKKTETSKPQTSKPQTSKPQTSKPQTSKSQPRPKSESDAETKTERKKAAARQPKLKMIEA